MKNQSHLTWDNFRATIAVPDQKRTHSVSNTPLIEIYSDGTNGRLGLLLEVQSQQVLPASLASLTFIKARIVTSDKRWLLDISVEGSGILRQFYHFAVAVSERILTDHAEAINAVSAELESFGALLEEQSKLGIERQVGLIGELLFLERLTSRHGIGAAKTWLGPLGEPHDFRLRKHEFEVKTTLSSQRIHVIHGVEQLIASDKCSLFVVSILLGPPGNSVGFSLSELVDSAARRLEPAPDLHSFFLKSLESVGYSTKDALLYSRRFILRRPLAIILVDNSCPSITRTKIQAAVGPSFARIGTIQYEVNLEGLEKNDDTDFFASAISP